MLALNRRLLSAATALLTGAAVLTIAPPPVNAASESPSLVWTRNTTGIIRESSPLAVDLTGDGQKEVVVGSRDGNVYALDPATGNDVSGWPRQTGDPIDSSPATADVNHDGSPEIFTGSGYGGARSGSFWSLTASGQTRWTYDPRDNDFPDLSVFSSPAIGDVNGDGVADVNVFPLGLIGWSFTVDGVMNQGWPFYQDDTVFSSPALYDIDGDGKTDYVVGGDSSPGLPIDHRGGFMRAIRGDGSLIWAFPMDEMGRSSPVIGDVDNDGEIEIVFGTGDYWVREPGGAGDSTKLFVLDRSGNLEWSRDLGGYTVASPALADVNGDGVLDIVEATWGGPDGGKVWAFDGHGNTLNHWAGRDSGGGIVLGQVATADFDADGGQDIVVNTGGGVYAYSGKTGAELWGVRQGASAYQNTAWIGDIDADSKLDIVLAGAMPGDTEGIIQRFEMPTTTAVLGSNNWSQFRKDDRHTGSWIATAMDQDYCSNAAGNSYRMVAADGGMFSYCGAGFYGSMGGQPLNKPIVTAARTASNNGYWEVASDGGIFSFGDAAFFGSMGGQPLNKPIVGMAATPSGNGYWMVASDGGIFAYGDAGFHGSMGGQALNQPIIGMATTPSGNGYWLMASDGGIFSFGDAKFHGSMGGQPLNKPIVGIASTLSGNGYWLVASDGGIFSFGDAAFLGSMGGSYLAKPIVGMTAKKSGMGYWLVASDGGIFAYDAPFLGSTGSIKLNQQIVGIVS